MDGNVVARTIIILFGVIALIAIILFAVLYPIFKKRYMYKNFKYVYYKKIYQIADKNDYLLLNNIVLTANNQKIATIDHILFANKFIYVINDKYKVGSINASKEDDVWLYFDKGGNKFEIHNPLKMNKKRIEKLSQLTSLDSSLFVSVVLINDDCVIKNINELNYKRNFIICYKDLAKLVKQVEKRKDVVKINEQAMDEVVKTLYRLYGKGKDLNE